jgi:hypothetical protein
MIIADVINSMFSEGKKWIFLFKSIACLFVHGNKHNNCDINLNVCLKKKKKKG